MEGLVTRAVMLVVLCAALYGILGPDCLPGSELFALGALAATAYVGGRVTRCLGLPPLVGMLAVGILYGNLPFIPFTEDISTRWASTLRNVSLSFILIKAGLGLDAVKLRALGLSVAGLSFVPCLAEAGTSALASHRLLGLPWVWAWMLGFILSAVSAAVLVPGALHLEESRLGTVLGVPTLLMASVSLDNVVALTGFLIAMNVVSSSDQSIAWTLMRRLLEPLAGLVFGSAFGILLWYFPEAGNSENLAFQRSSLLCLGGMAFTFVSMRIGVSGAGALGCVALAFCASLRWRRDEEKFRSISRITGFLWLLIEPFLFGLIGTEVTIESLKSNIGYGTLVLTCGVCVRMLATMFALLGSGLNKKEKVFVSLSWMSKATVQAAVGSQSLDYGRIHEKGPQFEHLSNQVLTVSVLSILLTAPLGAILMDLLGHRLLRKDEVITPKSTGYGSCLRSEDTAPIVSPDDPLRPSTDVP